MSNTIKSIYGKQYDYTGLANIPDIVEIDDTLSIEGKAADAKAVGDAIRSLSSQNVETDTSLTQSGKAADAAATGARLTALEQLGGITIIEPADGDIPQVYLTGVDGADAPITKTEVDFKLHYVSKTEEFTAFCTLKLQGDSSASTANKKKNYTVKMFSDATHETKLKKEFRDWGFKTNKYILKANWIDATHARQMVAYDIWSKIVKTREGYADSVEAALPNQGTSDGFPVVVYINGTYYGIYTWILPKSDTLFGVDEDNANQFVIYGQLNTDGTYRKTANNFRELWSGVNVDNWEIEVGTNSNIVKTAVNNFTNFVMTATDEEFYNNLGDYCNVQSLIDGYLFDYYLCGIDALAQNMILICRDGETFTLGVWDRDSTFGLWWNGSKILPTDYRCPEDYQEPYSLLWARLEGTFYNELKTRKAELRADGAPLSFANIVGTFDTFVHNIGDDRYDENNAAYTQPSKTTATKKQFREFVRDRLAYVDSCVDAFGTVIKCADITLTESDLVITENHVLTPVLVPRATTQEIVWQSSNENVAVVINGIITPVANGDTVITATCGQYSASCNVTVSGASEAVPCTGISLDAETLTFTAEGSQTLTATVTPDGCTDPVTWKSDNANVVTVNGGVVTAISNGSATITAKCGEYSASCSVLVSGIELSEPYYSWSDENIYEINEDGTVTETSDKYITNLFDVPYGSYRIVNNTGKRVWGYLAQYDSDGNFVVRVSLNALENGERSGWISVCEDLPSKLLIAAHIKDGIVLERSDGIWSEIACYDAPKTEAIQYLYNSTLSSFMTQKKIAVEGGKTYTLANKNGGAFEYKGVAEYKADGSFVKFEQQEGSITTPYTTTLDAETAYVYLIAGHGTDPNNCLEFTMVE